MNSNNAILVPPSGAATNGTNTLLDIRPPVEIPDGWAWLWWTLAVFALAVLAYWAWRRWNNLLTAGSPAPVVPAHIRARQRLEAALQLLVDPKSFCSEVSDAIRIYLEERFHFHAPDRTTEEFLQELQRTDLLTHEQKASLGDFLQGCDLVKFARYEPREMELRDLHGSALRLVDETRPNEVQIEPQSVKPADTPSQPPGEPFTFKDRFIGFVLGAAMILTGIATWLWPHLHLVPEESIKDATLGRGGHRLLGLLRVLEFLWSRPLGSVLAVVGVLVLWGVFTRKHKGAEK